MFLYVCEHSDVGGSFV